MRIEIPFSDIYAMGNKVGIMPLTDSGFKLLVSYILQSRAIGLERYLMQTTIDYANEKAIVE